MKAVENKSKVHLTKTMSIMKTSVKTKALRKLTLVTSGAVMAIGMLSPNLDSYARETSGTLKVVATDCIDSRTGEVIGHANNCESGTANCIDTSCGC